MGEQLICDIAVRGKALNTVEDKRVIEKAAVEHNGTNWAAPPGENPLGRVISGFADDPL